MKRRFLAMLLTGCLTVLTLFSFVGCGEAIKGEFYSLQGAYEEDLIQREDLQKIASYHNNHQTLEVFDEKLVNVIKDLFAKELREKSKEFSTITGDKIVLTKFYGEYGDCYVLMLDYGYHTDEYNPFDLEIAGIVFHFGHPRYVNRLVVYKDLTVGGIKK